MERPDNISIDVWTELSELEKVELFFKEEQEKIIKRAGFVDCNNYTLDELVEYLEKKWMYSSNIDSLAIHKLIDFYKQHKEEPKEEPKEE